MVRFKAVWRLYLPPIHCMYLSLSKYVKCLYFTCLAFWMKFDFVLYEQLYRDRKHPIFFVYMLCVYAFMWCVCQSCCRQGSVFFKHSLFSLSLCLTFLFLIALNKVKNTKLQFIYLLVCFCKRTRSMMFIIK